MPGPGADAPTTAPLEILDGEAPPRRGRATACLARVRRRCSRIRDWLPTVCSCFEEGPAPLARSVGSYRRLGGAVPAAEAQPEADGRPTEVEQLRFHCDDLTSCSVGVERSLRAAELAEALGSRKGPAEAGGWSIVESWPDLGIERTLEDHESVLAVHGETKALAARRPRRFFYRRDPLKYQVFLDPRRFFPPEMIAVPGVFADRGPRPSSEATRPDAELDEVIEEPRMFGSAWIRTGRFDAWSRSHVLLRDRELYLAKKGGTGRAIPFAALADHAVYGIPNAKRSFGAPVPWGICLRPGRDRDGDGGGDAGRPASGESGLKVVAFPSEKSRACWLAAMRLAKYGKQLRENYRAFKNRQAERSGGPKERGASCGASSESMRSRVAMDFTGSVGRLVEDPKEARTIAESEGASWRRAWRPFSRPPPGCAGPGPDDGARVPQPWFHRGLGRERAAAIVGDRGSVDGAFLVRESRSNLGAYVLTYKCSGKVFHAQIQPVFDERRGCWLYTLDKGVTRFYDLPQLIEFYQLNAGCLPTRLARYVRSGESSAAADDAVDEERRPPGPVRA